MLPAGSRQNNIRKSAYDSWFVHLHLTEGVVANFVSLGGVAVSNMPVIKYSKLRVMIADDFSNFRSTVTGMLSKMGVTQIESVANAASLIRACESKRYDIILCDYDLGAGKSGQQALEELHHRGLLPRSSAFIIVSADATKDVVMASYDCEPNDYLMKPITAKVLQKRIDRILLRMETLTPVYQALDAHDSSRAISLLIDISVSESRHALYAQKLLGELFIEQGELTKAEKLFTKALEVRPVDWARLGLAKVKHLAGEFDLAGEWLEKIVSDSPLFLPAYDSLALNWEKRGEYAEVQATVKRSVGISPKSILRQKRLAQVAERNGDLLTALDALEETIKLGMLSCHASAEDGFNFARVASASIDKRLAPKDALCAKALEVLEGVRERFSLTRDQDDRADVLQGLVMALGGDEEGGRALLESVAGVAKCTENQALDVSIERVNALQAVGKETDAKVFIQQLLEANSFDQAALERLDSLLPEPVSEANRVMVANVNREGIELYNQHRFDDALECFQKVSVIFPKHVGVHLNIAQALIGKMQKYPSSDVRDLTRETLETISLLVEPGHEQYLRLERLQQLAVGANQQTQ